MNCLGELKLWQFHAKQLIVAGRVDRQPLPLEILAFFCYKAIRGSNYEVVHFCGVVSFFIWGTDRKIASVKDTTKEFFSIGHGHALTTNWSAVINCWSQLCMSVWRSWLSFSVRNWVESMMSNGTESTLSIHSSKSMFATVTFPTFSLQPL